MWIRNKAELTTYDPEEIQSWELGLKSDLFDRRLRWNVAAYQSEVTGYQASVQNLETDPSSNDIVNVDDITFTGIENELTWAPVRSVRVNLSYTWQDADAPSTIPSLTGGTIGFQAPNIPEAQASAAVDWTIPLAGVDLVPHVDYAYQSDFFESPGKPDFTKPEPSSVSMLNARLALQRIPLGNNSLSIAVWGKNLSGSDDYVFTFPAPTSDFTVAATPGGAAYTVPPRTYGLDLRYEF